MRDAIVRSALAAPLLAAASLALPLTGCPGPGASAPQPPPGAPDVRVDLPEKAAYGERVEAKIHVTNPTDRPIALLGIAVTAGKRELTRAAEPRPLQAVAREDGGFDVRGVLEVEDLGPIARAPGRPRWRWEGEATLVTLAILAPGQGMSGAGRARASDDLAQVDVTILYAPLAPTTTVLTSEKGTIEPAAPPAAAPVMTAPGRERWVAAARATCLYTRALTLGPEGATPLAWATAPDFLLAAEAPRAWRYAVPASVAEAAGMKGARLSARMRIERPSFDLPAARAASGIAEGGSLYAMDAGAWLLEPIGRDPVLVDAQGAVAIGGLPRPLVEALNDAPAVPLRLERDLAPERAGAIAAELTKAGFAVSERAEKGGGTSREVRVPAESLCKLCRTLHAAGATVSGDTIRDR